MMDNNEAVWGTDESIYVVGDGGKSYGTLNMVWRSEDGKSAMFSGKITGDANKLEHLVYPVPTDNKIRMDAMDGSSHNAPMLGSIVDGEVTGLGYEGGLVKLELSTGAAGESFTVKASDNAGVSIVGGYYTFDPADGTLTYTETTGDVLEISNVPADGIAWVPVASDAPKGTPETITVSVTDKFGNTISGNVEVHEGGAAASDDNSFPKMTYDETTGLAPDSEDVEIVDGADALREAFANGGQYTLTDDVTITETLTLAEGKALYLDLGGNTINIDGQSATSVLDIANRGTMNIFNGNISASNYENSRRCIYNYGTMTIGKADGSASVTFTQTFGEKGAAINNEGNMVIYDGTNVTANYYAIWNSGTNTELTIKGGKFISKNNSASRPCYAVTNRDDASLVVNNGSFTGNHGVISSINNGAAILKAGSYECEAEYSGDSDWTLYVNNGGLIEYNDNCSITHRTKSKYDSMYEENGGKIYVAVNNQNQLKEVIKTYHERIILEDGDYELSELEWKYVDLIGRNRIGCVAKISKSFYGQDLRIGLQNMTIEVPTGLGYTEQAFAFIHKLKQLNVDKCTINGSLRLNVAYGEINNCEFNVKTAGGFDGYGLYYYGNDKSEVKIMNSKFNTVSKGIVIYSEGAKTYNLEVNKCEFKATTPADKAAIQMHTEYGITGDVTITETTATGFANINNGLWNEINNTTGVETFRFNITVDNELVHESK